MTDFWKIDGKDLPGFVLNKGELKSYHMESGVPDDTNVNLRLLRKYNGIALIDAVDGRETTDGSPNYKKFMCYSFWEEENQHIITTYLVNLYDGPVNVRASDPEKKSLLERIDMFHIDITPDRIPERVIQKHLERINGKNLLTKGLRKQAEKIYFDMLWNVPVLYCLYRPSKPLKQPILAHMFL